MVQHGRRTSCADDRRSHRRTRRAPLAQRQRTVVDHPADRGCRGRACPPSATRPCWSARRRAPAAARRTAPSRTRHRVPATWPRAATPGRTTRSIDVFTNCPTDSAASSDAPAANPWCQPARGISEGENAANRARVSSGDDGPPSGLIAVCDAHHGGGVRWCNHSRPPVVVPMLVQPHPAAIHPHRVNGPAAPGPTLPLDLPKRSIRAAGSQRPAVSCRTGGASRRPATPPRSHRRS